LEYGGLLVKLTYRGILRESYYSPRRRVYAHGQIIDFVEGVAHGLSEATAVELFRRKIIKEYVPTYPLEKVDDIEASLSRFVPEAKIREFYETDAPEQSQPEFTTEQLEEMGDVEPLREELVDEDASEVELPDFTQGTTEDSSLEEEEEEEEEEEAQQTGDEEITKELIENLYNELGTWTAVANHLGITTTRLKKYRDEFGL